MPIYSKPQIDLLVDLINESNPGLNLAPINLENTRLGLPYPRTPKDGEIADTSIEIFPRDSSFFIGRVVVHYRRIKLENLFANKTVQYDRWRGRRLEREDIARWLNRDYGTTFVPEDFTGSGYPSRSYTQRNDIHPHSLCYQGTFFFRWNQGKRELDQILDDLTWDPNRVYPQPRTRRWSEFHAATPGGTNDSDTRPLLTHVGFGIDYSAFCNTLESIPMASVVDETLTRLATVIRHFTALTGVTLSLEKDHTEEGGLRGLDFFQYPLPHTSVSEANLFDYRYVACITAKEDSWFGGRLVFHYNKEAVQLSFDTLGLMEAVDVYIKKYDPAILTGSRYWELEEVAFENGMPVAKRRLPSMSGTFDLDPSVNCQPVPILVEPGDDVDTDTEVRVVIKSTTNGDRLSQSAVFTLAVTPRFELADTALEYGDTTSFTVSNLPLYDGTEVRWSLKDVDGVVDPVEGTLTSHGRRITGTTKVPLAYYFDNVQECYITLEDSEGSLLSTSEVITLTGEVVVTDSVTYTEDFTRTFDTDTAIRYSVAGAGGGGGGGHYYNSGGRPRWYDGGMGGSGALVIGGAVVKAGTTVEGSLPEGGTTPTQTGHNGTDASPTTLTLSEETVQALGGLGGFYDGRQGTPTPQLPEGGGQGGQGRIWEHPEWLPGTNGEKGWIVIETLGKAT